MLLCELDDEDDEEEAEAAFNNRRKVIQEKLNELKSLISNREQYFNEHCCFF